MKEDLTVGSYVLLESNARMVQLEELKVKAKRRCWWGSVEIRTEAGSF
jgi:hypothetical protein